MHTLFLNKAALALSVTDFNEKTKTVLSVCRYMCTYNIYRNMIFSGEFKMIVIHVFLQTITLKNEMEREFKVPPKPSLPPPPPMFKLESPKKNIPRSSNPLKCFNWSKLPDAKINGTIWTELDETKLYRVLDLEDIDREFCSYLKNGLNTEGSVEDLPNAKNRSKVCTFIILTSM